MRPRKEPPRNLPGSASKEQRLERAKDIAALMADPATTMRSIPIAQSGDG
ncbi:MAG: hypothetical protein HQ477_13260 [Chloroflexi bacterium]|nr:hypothetical protein [Chloroflexota bacterium]